MADRIVIGPVVVLPDPNGLIQYYYQGATLPDGLDEDRVRSAIDAGLVSEEKSADELTADDLNVAVSGDAFRNRSGLDEGVSQELLGAPSAASSDGDRPARTASKDAWVDYAVAQGADRDEADALTKAELIDRYGA